MKMRDNLAAEISFDVQKGSPSKGVSLFFASDRGAPGRFQQGRVGVGRRLPLTKPLRTLPDRSVKKINSEYSHGSTGPGASGLRLVPTPEMKHKKLFQFKVYPPPRLRHTAEHAAFFSIIPSWHTSLLVLSIVTMFKPSSSALNIQRAKDLSWRRCWSFSITELL